MEPAWFEGMNVAFERAEAQSVKYVDYWHKTKLLYLQTRQY